MTGPSTTEPVVLAASPLTAAGAEAAVYPETTSAATEASLPRMRASVIWALVLMTFGTSMAMVVPLAYALTVRIADLAPGREDLLGYIIGAAAIANVVTMPLIGVLSDRTRTRLGRRRPWVIGGGVVGLLGLFALAVAPSVLLLGIGWMVTLVAWQSAGNQATYLQGDKLPEEQRGRVAAFTGFANLVAPIIGIVIVSGFSSNMLALFLVPGIVGIVGIALFTALVLEDSRDLVVEPISVRSVLGKYVFSPRRHRDYGWNWLGRFILFFGLSFTTTYGTFFLASRMNLEVNQVAGLVAITGLGGVVAGAIGALGAGFLSDRLHRRKIFVLIGGALASPISAVRPCALPGAG